METQWEYKIIRRSMSDEPMDEINALGRDGWEMFFYHGSAQWYRYWFRRPLPGPSPTFHTGQRTG